MRLGETSVTLHRVSIIAASTAALLSAGCGTLSTRAKVERSRQQSVAEVERLDSARERIVKLEQDKVAQKEQIGRLEEQIAAHHKAEDLWKKRLAASQKEASRLQTEAASAVMSSVGVTPVKRTEPGPETEPFRLPASLVGRLNDMSKQTKAVQFDKKLKALKLDGSFMFGSGDILKPDAQKALSDFARSMQMPEARNLKLLIAVQVDPKNQPPQGLEKLYPTDWHLAAHQAVAIHQYLESRGLSAANVGVTVQQYPATAAASRPRVEIYINEPDVNVE
jgi:cell division septum initiation protein DivIVA